jgi:Zn-finger nucleic acid-binding protein
MNCPVDGTELRMGDRQGVEIDYCPTCRGIWLDRGELDKIIERLSNAPWAEDDREFKSAPEVRGHQDQRKRKRKSFLSDMFEFGE